MGANKEWPVYRYDGTNAETIVRALGLREGDVVVPFDEKTIIIKATDWDKLKVEYGRPTAD